MNEPVLALYEGNFRERMLSFWLVLAAATAVDDEAATRGVVAHVACKEEEGIGDLLRRADALERTIVAAGGNERQRGKACGVSGSGQGCELSGDPGRQILRELPVFACVLLRQRRSGQHK